MNAKRVLNRKLAVFVGVIAIVIMGVCFLTHIQNENNKNLLLAFGWHPTNDAHGTSMLLKEPGNDDFQNWKIAACYNAGYHPERYYGKTVERYGYQLQELGGQNSLEACIWVYQQQIIGAYITHGESNYRIKFWPVNTPLNTILSDLKSLNELKQS